MNNFSLLDFFSIWRKFTINFLDNFDFKKKNYEILMWFFLAIFCTLSDFYRKTTTYMFIIIPPLIEWSGGYIAITLSVRSHFHNRYLGFYWKK